MCGAYIILLMVLKSSGVFELNDISQTSSKYSPKKTLIDIVYIEPFNV